MFFRVKKELRWDGKEYQPGNIVDIPEGNPRIEGLMMGSFITYDSCAPSSDDQTGVPVEIANKRKSRRVGRRPEE